MAEDGFGADGAEDALDPLAVTPLVAGRRVAAANARADSIWRKSGPPLLFSPGRNASNQLKAEALGGVRTTDFPSKPIPSGRNSFCRVRNANVDDCSDHGPQHRSVRGPRGRNCGYPLRGALGGSEEQFNQDVRHGLRASAQFFDLLIGQIVRVRSEERETPFQRHRIIDVIELRGRARCARSWQRRHDGSLRELRRELEGNGRHAHRSASL